MNANMSSAQAQKKNAQEFRRQLTVLHQAAIGVIQVRTKEPYRAVEAMRDFAFAENLDFKLWTVLQGWQSFDKTKPTDEPTIDSTVEPLQALKKITAMDMPPAQRANNAFPERGVYVMMHPHKMLTQHLGMVQIIKEYSKTFCTHYRRLVIVTPFSYQLPEELQDDVIILDFDPPSFAELKESLQRFLSDIKEDKRPRYSDAELDKIVANGTGMTRTEFENAVSRATVAKRAQLPNVPVDELSKMIGDVKTEVVKRSEVLELMEPEPIENIGGLDNLKEWIGKRRTVFSQAARDFGIEPPKGIALIGPPGTGKSASAKAIASVLGLSMLKFDVGRVFQSLVGQSEARVREALKMVDAQSPCVLLIDEADKAFQVGSGGDSGVGQRVLGAILTWMQETKSPVFTVVTANRVENLPSEFLRRGRLDEVFSVTTPNETERLEIIKIHLRKRKQDFNRVSGLEEAVASSAGYVSAELEAAVKDGLIEAFTGGIPITGALIAQQLQYMVPLSEAFKAQFDAMATWAENNARPASRAEGETSQPKLRRRTPVVASAPVQTTGGRAMALDAPKSALDS
ncbi:AAA family ATPase (plasmid) [Rhizobium bangladeshense]|uniref:AAA family ATPase n=1 Tax=Rhizobium bangladeshense TaxID=1138189 RepID=UPI001A98640C|nr:AAA family ATPase [Rhizobium bangladeshense]QSY98670.1 AAA family ATPase [Rhizobium bangladeshense]